jgi:PKD repeat protein
LDFIIIIINIAIQNTINHFIMKNKYVNYFLASALLCVATTKLATAQWSEGTCGNFNATQALEASHPELVQQRIDYDKALTDAVKERQKSPMTSSQVYIIPIVFHILHVNGPENITDAQIFAQVAKMNTDWRKLNADTSTIVPSFVALAADVHIEFRLAQLDPNGNCTNGIDRIYTHKTYNADESCKLNQWPRDKYMNVWVVNSIGTTPGVAGYALYPSSVATFGYPYDGVVMLYSVCNGASRVLTHEIAHCFSLQHTFGDTNTPGVTCADDLVDDTPITKGHPNVCPLNDSTCTAGVIENVQNYMEYATCPVMFTIGQRDRMQAALNSTIAQRNNLWINSNLAATGTDGAVYPVCTPVPDFYVNHNTVCPGSTVTFTKNIQAGTPVGTPATKWTFAGGTPSTSTSTSATQIVTYNTPGAYDVKLWVQNASGQDSLVKTSYIFVSAPYAQVSPGIMTENCDNSAQYYSRWRTEDLDNNMRTWWLTSTASYSGSQSVVMNGYYNYVNDVDNLYSPSFDLSYVTGATINFRCAAATKATTAADMNEKLRVLVSKDCGATWLQCGAVLSGASLINNGFHPEEFIPNSASQWAYITRSITPSYVTSSTQFKFEFTSGNQTNDIYIDDINISGTVGVTESPLEETSVSLYPNPSNQSSTLSYHLNVKADTKIEMIDVLGKKIMEVNNLNQAEGDYTVQLSKQDLHLYNGIYFVKISVNNNTITKKLIITE